MPEILGVIPELSGSGQSLGIGRATMTREQFAERIKRKQYGSELSIDDTKIAKESGLIVIFAISEEITAVRGAFSAEVETRDIYLYAHSGGVLKSGHVRAIADPYHAAGYPNRYETAVPHSEFSIEEKNKFYCRGIVISVADLPEIGGVPATT